MVRNDEPSPMRQMNEVEPRHKIGTRSRRHAQIMIVLDRTGSMGSIIKAVKECILGFVGALRKEAFEAEVGLIAFRDLHAPTGPQLPELHQFSGRIFTDDIEGVRAKLDRLEAKGGGKDHWESSFDAMYHACQQPFQPSAGKYLCVITDQPPHSPHSPGSRWPDGAVTTMDVLRLALARPPIDHVYFIVRPRDRDDFDRVPEVPRSFFPLPPRGGDIQNAFGQILDKIAQDIARRGMRRSPTP